MKEFFKDYNPRSGALNIVRTANQIIEDYTKQGFKLTLRQLYYQFVSKDLIPNTEKSYKKLGTIISRARLAGAVDWGAIEDRVRRPQQPPEFDDIEDLIETAFASYRLPRLRGQDTYVELWVEKDALAGVLAPIAYEHHVTLMVNRGYSSSSAMKESGDRIQAKCKTYGCIKAHVLYLGDLDPSGEDMVRDIDERLESFVNDGWFFFDLEEPDDDGCPVRIETPAEQETRKPCVELTVTKVALTMPQVDEHKPPPNPAKLTDPRAKDFIRKYGGSSWEVDALPPQVLREVIVEALEDLLDMDLMQEVHDEEEEHKRKLREALSNS